MDATNQKLLQNVMNKINNHPISHIFYRPIGNNSSIDLKIVSNRIQQNLYRNITEFLADIEAICSNARSNLDKTRYYIASADFLKKLVYKEVHRLNGIKDTHDWCNETYRIREKLKILIYSPPTMANEKFSTGIDPARPVEGQLPTESTLKKLIDLSSRSITSSDFDVISHMINFYQPNLPVKETFPIDVRKLSTPTINALMDYMEKKLISRIVPKHDLIHAFTGA